MTVICSSCGKLRHPEKECFPMPKFKNPEAEAAYWLADLFSATVLQKLQSGHGDLYVWERGALEWLKEWRKRDQDTPINAWTSCYMRHGPPPWRPDQQ